MIKLALAIAFILVFTFVGFLAVALLVNNKPKTKKNVK